MISAAVSPAAWADAGGIEIDGLRAEVRAAVDADGVTHLSARDDLDLARIQGFVHARDRFFQMDLMRRQGSGELAELFGSERLPQDIASRTLGLHRAAQRSLEAQSPRERALLQAYADGVNAFLRQGPLPREYALLELTQARPWAPVDSHTVLKVILASLSIELDAERTAQLTEYARAGISGGFDGSALFFEDVRRVAPMDPSITVTDAGGMVPFVANRVELDAAELERASQAATSAQAKLEQVPYLVQAMRRQELGIGSNEWGVAGERSRSGHPMIANDPHLPLDVPTTFYEWRLEVSRDPSLGRMNAAGVSFPGVPGVVQGQNEHISWGSTTNSLDASDLFIDTLIVDPDGICAPVKSQACILTEGEPRAVEIENATYRVNVLGDGVLDNVLPAALPAEQTRIATVPFRSFGPILSLIDPTVLTRGGMTSATVLQYTGFHGTRDMRAISAFGRARSIDEFAAALRDADVGSQNWVVADAQGNLAYLTSAESPLRRDLEAGRIAGLPPFFLRDGSGAANWVSDPDRLQGQAIPFATLPIEEMPQVVNPPAGFFVNANNDPVGVTLDNDAVNQRRATKPSAIYYLSSLYAEGLRAGRITRLLQQQIDAGRKISFEDMQEIQANVQQLDAELMIPFLNEAWARARRPDAPSAVAAFADDPEVREAVTRLARWDFSTPTGVAEGYDASDRDGRRSPRVSRDEARASVAATIYNLWRAKLVRRVVEDTLERIGVSPVTGFDAFKATFNLLQQRPFTGVGASGVDFFPFPAAPLDDAADRRDATLLAAMREALDALASEDFAVAFGGSRNPDDYRWGKLHRITFDHPFVPAFSIPPAGGFEDFAPGLPGLSRDGGFESVNQAGFSPTADRPQDFVFMIGPNRRYVGEVRARGRGLLGRLLFGDWLDVRSATRGRLDRGPGVKGVNVIPGGPSGDPSSPLYATQLPDWLTADYHDVRMESPRSRALTRERFVPARRRSERR